MSEQISQDQILRMAVLLYRISEQLEKMAQLTAGFAQELEIIRASDGDGNG